MVSCPGLFIWYACSDGSTAGDRAPTGFNGRFTKHFKTALWTERKMKWIDVVRAVTRSMEGEANTLKTSADSRQRPQYTETLYRSLFLHASQDKPQEDNP